MSYEWNNTLFDRAEDMLAAMFEKWVTAWGENTKAEVLEFFEENSDEELAAEFVETWGLNERHEKKKYWLDNEDNEDESLSFMEEHDFTQEDVVNVVARIRKWWYENFVLNDKNVYEWSGVFYRTLDGMLDVMVDRWLTSCCDTPRNEALKILDEKTDEELADEIIKDYELNDPYYENHFSKGNFLSHMEKHKYTKEDLSKAFARAKAWHKENCRLDEKNDYKWQFRSTPYRTLDNMLDAMVESWLTEDGDRARTEVLKFFFDRKTDKELAEKIIKDWSLDQPSESDYSEEEKQPSHMAEHEYTKEDLIKAFARARTWYEENFVFTEEDYKLNKKDNASDSYKVL